MNNTCVTCGQILPKTVLVCPSCGGRQFSGIDTSVKPASQPTPTTQYHVPFESQLAANGLASSHNVNQNPSQSPSQNTSQAISPPQATIATPVQSPPQPSGQNHFQNTPSSIAPSYAQNYVTPPYIPPAEVASYLPPVATAPLKPANTMLYAGFLRRGFAFAFDIALFSLLTGLAWQYIENNKIKILYVTNTKLPLALTLAGAGLYLLMTAFLTSRARQGSIGKRMLGLWVFNMQGQRIGFFHAFFREVVKLGLLPFVFLMWFTARKQTLHDLIGRTVVLFDAY